MPAWVFVTNIPSPYQVDFFSSLQQIIPGRFHVLFCAASESDRLFRTDTDLPFPHTVLQSQPSVLRKDWHRSDNLQIVLQGLSPSLVVLGGSYFMPDARTVRAWCRKRGIRWVYWGEDPEKKRVTGFRGCAKRIYLSWFLRCDALIGIGSVAVQHYRALRPELPIENVPYAPALQAIAEPDEATRRKASSIRRLYANADMLPLLILFAGHFSERKAPDLLIESFSRIAAQFPTARLVMAGDGPLLEPMKLLARERHIGNRVIFPGFLHGAELMSAYLACDLFVLPTRQHEGWGVVVQEAMAAGLPVIVSDVVGAGRDLVQGKETGLVFPANDVDALASCLASLCSSPSLRTTFARNAKTIVMPTSSAEAARRVIRFLDGVERSDSTRM